MPVNKNDSHARDLWGDLYDRIPKSVFATVAIHLANVASGEADTPSAAERRFLEEWEILHKGGHMPQRPSRKVKERLA